jgi:hypothetical protein
MTEKNFEEFLRKAAESYNAPPARTPREEMWNAIQAKRAAGPRVVYGGGSAVPATREKRFGTRVWIGAAAAAMLLVATGVGIGRWTAGPAASASVATNPLLKKPVVVMPGPDAGTVIDQPPTPTANSAPAVRSPSGRQVATGTSGQSNSNRTSTNGSERLPSVAGSSSAYQLTTVQHLSEAEALLTSFRTRSTADQQMDAQLGAWARQLLSNTRLLLDSPVANDPQRRPLLEDLELVLVQIVQLSPGSTPQDRDMIEKTLQEDHVMTRLRTAIPAGAQRGS